MQNDRNSVREGEAPRRGLQHTLARRYRQLGNLQPPAWLQSFFGMTFFYGGLIAVQTALFVYYKKAMPMLILYSILPGMLLGISVRVFEWFVSLLRGLIAYLLGRVLAGFVLFFVYLIGYIVIFSGVVAYPLDHVIQQKLGSVELSRDYGLYSVNSIMVIAVISWLQWLRGIVWNPPRRTAKNTGL